MSGQQDSNLRPPVPKTGAPAKLSYALYSLQAGVDTLGLRSPPATPFDAFAWETPSSRLNANMPYASTSPCALVLPVNWLRRVDLNH